jgi:hypothetical protein
MTSPIGATTWTVNSLAVYIRGITGRDPDAQGGSAPDRIVQTVRSCGMKLWNTWLWRFRKKAGTLTLSTGTASVAVPADFDRLDQQWLRDPSNSPSGLWFTEDPTVYQETMDRYQPGQNAPPRIACLAWDSTANAFAFQIAPPSDVAHSYTYWYMTSDPWTNGTMLNHDTVPSWPANFHEGWQLLSTLACMRLFTEGDQWESHKGDFKEWLDLQLAGNQTLTMPDRIQDGYRDLNRFTTGRDVWSWL